MGRSSEKGTAFAAPRRLQSQRGFWLLEGMLVVENGTGSELAYSIFEAGVDRLLLCRDVRIFALYSPAMFPCSPCSQPARPLSPASVADVTCRPGGRNSFSSPSRLNAPLCGELRQNGPSEVLLGSPDQLDTRQQRAGCRECPTRTLECPG